MEFIPNGACACVYVCIQCTQLNKSWCFEWAHTQQQKLSMISFAPNDIDIILNEFIAASHLEIELVIEYYKSIFFLFRLKRKFARKGNE